MIISLAESVGTGGGRSSGGTVMMTHGYSLLAIRALGGGTSEDPTAPPGRWQAVSRDRTRVSLR
jgi:hypothetical protein